MPITDITKATAIPAAVDVRQSRSSRKAIPPDKSPPVMAQGSAPALSQERQENQHRYDCDKYKYNPVHSRLLAIYHGFPSEKGRKAYSAHPWLQRT